MSFAQLLQNVGSYLDFSKRMATTVPGLIMALALVLLTGTLPDWAARPFACSDTLQAERRAAAADARLQEFDGTWPARPQEDVDRRFLLRTKERTYKRDYGAALGAAASCRTQCAEKVTAVENALRTAHTFETSPDGAAWQTYRAAIVTAAKTGDSAAKSAVDDEAALGAADWHLARNAAGDRCSAPRPDWSVLANQLLLFGLLGFAFGVVFDPINKALFLQVFPDAVAGAAKSATTRLAKVMSTLVNSSVGLLVPKAAVQRAYVKTSGENDPLAGHTPQFWVGRGIITDGEYQDLVDRYYRFSELTIGLVLPIALIGLAILLHERALGYSARGVAWFLAALAAGVFMGRLGVRRHVEFTEAVRELISGRLEKLAEQERVAHGGVDLMQLHALVDQAGRIMALWARMGPP